MSIAAVMLMYPVASFECMAGYREVSVPIKKVGDIGRGYEVATEPKVQFKQKGRLMKINGMTSVNITGNIMPRNCFRGGIY